MSFPNGLDFDGTTLYVSDSSSGTIYEVAPNGTTTVWIQDALLVGDQTACGGSGAGFDIGANGIVHDTTDRYVAVTDFGRIVRIPIMGNGSAGTPVVHSEDCGELQGVDGIALDRDGSIIAVRNGPSNTMVRVSADGGTRTPMHVGPPLDGPASIVIDAPGGDRRALITNSAFFSGATGTPGLVAYDLLD
jgi:sugar lactone lactonase YvrE